MNYRNALADEVYLQKSARKSGADPELLREECVIMVALDEAKTVKDFDMIKELTARLIDVQRRQPVIGVAFR